MKLINGKEVIELPTPIRVAFNPMDVEGSVTWGK
jgi:hypothetical protein